MRLWTVIVVLAIAGRSAAAQTTTIQADGAVNVGYGAQTQVDTTINSMTEDPPTELNGYFFTEVRPGISLQTESPRLTWRFAYVFAGNFALGGQGTNAYSNQANVSLAAELSRRSVMTLAATANQGGALFQVRAAGGPEVRAQGSPETVSGSVAETYVYELGRQLSFGQGLTAAASAPQDQLDRNNVSVTGSLSLDRSFQTDAIGMELRSNVGRLDQLEGRRDPYLSVTNTLLGRLNHDFSWRWNGQLSAGVQQVYADTGSRPVAILPTGSAAVRFFAGKGLGAVSYNHGAATNVQTGTVATNDSVVATAIVNFDLVRPQLLTVSAGFVHNEPITKADALIAAGTGNAVSGDISFLTGISRGILATARYSLAYQYGQEGDLPPNMAHIFLVGLTARYTNSSRYTPPVPRTGQRVDGADSVGFGDRDAR